MPRSNVSDIGERRMSFLMTGYDRLEIVLPAKLKRELATEAAKQRMTMTDVTVDALRAYLENLR